MMWMPTFLVGISVFFVSWLKTWVSYTIPHLHIVFEASGELNKSLMNQRDWYITTNDVKHMEITDWETNIYTKLQLIAVLIKALIRKGL